MGLTETLEFFFGGFESTLWRAIFPDSGWTEWKGKKALLSSLTGNETFKVLPPATGLGVSGVGVLLKWSSGSELGF